MIEYDLKSFLAINLEYSKIDNSIKIFAVILCSYSHSIFIKLSFPSELVVSSDLILISLAIKVSFDTN